MNDEATDYAQNSQEAAFRPGDRQPGISAVRTVQWKTIPAADRGVLYAVGPVIHTGTSTAYSLRLLTAQIEAKFPAYGGWLNFWSKHIFHIIIMYMYLACAEGILSPIVFARQTYTPPTQSNTVHRHTQPIAKILRQGHNRGHAGLDGV